MKRIRLYRPSLKDKINMAIEKFKLFERNIKAGMNEREAALRTGITEYYFNRYILFKNVTDFFKLRILKGISDSVKYKKNFLTVINEKNYMDKFNFYFRLDGVRFLKENGNEEPTYEELVKLIKDSMESDKNTAISIDQYKI